MSQETVEKDYNSRRPLMVIPEYGRNIQKMVEFALGVEDREERNTVAHAIITVMGNLNQHLRDVPDFKHKLWDHLYIISNYQLDVDSPYPKPLPEVINEKPKPMGYPKHRIKFKHYGHILEELIKKAVETEDPAEKKALTEEIAATMKRSYLIWNKESVDDEQITKDLDILSDGKLDLSNDFEYESTNQILAKNKPKTSAPSNTRRRKKRSKNRR